jgi:hypothetical protein
MDGTLLGVSDWLITLNLEKPEDHLDPFCVALVSILADHFGLSESN